MFFSRTFVILLNRAPGVNTAGFLALAYLLHLLVVERPDVALPHLHDVVADLAVEALYYYLQFLLPSK